jgi:hypothetical protein
MRSSTTIYSGRTSLGRETFSKLHEGTTAEDHIYTKRVKSTYCSPSRCIKVTNYGELNAIRAAFRGKYLANQDTIKSQKNSLVSGLYTTLDLNNIGLNNIRVIAANTTPFGSPTPISKTSVPYTDYRIDPSGNLFGNTVCGLNNFINYKVGNNSALNKILHL